MKNSLAYALVLILCLSSVSSAQNAKLTPPPKGKYKFDGKIETIYDKAKDETSLFFKPLSIKNAAWPLYEGTDVVNEERMDISMYFSYAGQKLITPEWVGVGFSSLTSNPKEYTDYNLTFFADGQAIPLDKVKVVKSVDGNRGLRQLNYGMFESRIPYEKFLLLANAKKVKFRIGAKEFDLEKQHLEAIRDLASRTVP